MVSLEKGFWDTGKMNGFPPDRQIGIDLFVSNDPTDIRVQTTESSE